MSTLLCWAGGGAGPGASTLTPHVVSAPAPATPLSCRDKPLAEADTEAEPGVRLLMLAVCCVDSVDPYPASTAPERELVSFRAMDMIQLS